MSATTTGSASGAIPTREGTLSAHAELWRNEQTMVTALRYDDVYRREEGVWRFAERALSFLYYAPLAIIRQSSALATACAPTTSRPRPIIPSSCRAGRIIACEPAAAQLRGFEVGETRTSRTARP